MIKKILVTNLILLGILFSIGLSPKTTCAFEITTCQSGKFIPCDGTDACPCTFPKLMELVSNILNFLVNVIAFPLAVITFTYAGFLYMTTAVSDKRSKAKDMMVKVVIGFAVLLAANLIVKTVLGVLLDPSIMNKALLF